MTQSLVDISQIKDRQLAGIIDVAETSRYQSLNALSLAAARARLSNPRDNAVMASPPTITAAYKWAINTAYLINQYAVNGSKRYIVTTGGTSAASGGPTGTGTGIADNTVVWDFVDDLKTAAFSIAGTNSYLWSTSTVAGGGTKKEVFNYYGGLRANNPNGGVNYAKMYSVTVVGALTGSMQRVEFVADSAKFCIRISEVNTGGMHRLIVDGQFASLTPVTPPHAGFNYIVVDFSSAGGRKPRNIIHEFGGSTAWGGVDVLITEGVYKVGGTSILKAAVTGDSYAASGGVTNSNDGWQCVAADLLGIRNIEGTAIGGTGLLTSSSSGTALSRVSDVINFAPDIVFVCLGGNDTSFTSAQITAAMTTYIRTLRASLPNAVFFVFGIMRGNQPPDMTLTIAAENAISTAMTTLQLTDKLLFFFPVATLTEGQWMTGTGNTGATDGTGNADVYIAASDGVHPNEAGHIFLGRRVADTILKFLADNGY